MIVSAANAAVSTPSQVPTYLPRPVAQGADTPAEIGLVPTREQCLDHREQNALDDNVKVHCSTTTDSFCYYQTHNGGITTKNESTTHEPRITQPYDTNRQTESSPQYDHANLHSSGYLCSQSKYPWRTITTLIFLRRLIMILASH